MGAGDGRAIGRILDGAVYDARREAEAILAAARAEVATLREQIVATTAAAREAGYRQGLEEGRAAAAATLATARAHAEEMRQGARAELALLSRRIAERILGRELLEPEAVADLVAAALEAATLRGEVVVRIHPDDRAALDAAHARLAAIARRARSIAFVDDPAMDRGGCLIETAGGSFDGRIEVQLAAFERALAELSP